MNRAPNPFGQPTPRPATEAEVKKFMDEKSGETTGEIPFPQNAMTGSLGEFAHELADGTEVPEEFFFSAGLTVIGSLCVQRLKVRANLESEPRLYTVLLGASADVKKSTALRNTIKTLLPLLLG